MICAYELFWLTLRMKSRADQEMTSEAWRPYRACQATLSFDTCEAQRVEYERERLPKYDKEEELLQSIPFYN